MAYAEWFQAITTNDPKLNSKMSSTLSRKSTTADVDATPNTFNHSYGTTNTVRVNSNGTNEAGVSFHFGNLEVGDLIEIEAEIRVISGENPILQLSEYNLSDGSESNKNSKRFTGKNEFQTVKFKHFITITNNWGNNRAFIGLETGKSGVFEMRSVRAVAYTKTQQPQDKIDKGYYRFIVKKVAGVWTLQNGSSSGISVAKPYDWILELNYPSQAYPSVHITATNSNLYNYGCSIPTATKVNLSCKKVGDETSASNNWTQIPDDTVLYVQIVYAY